mgnify:CR=1 FL=1
MEKAKKGLSNDSERFEYAFVFSTFACIAIGILLLLGGLRILVTYMPTLFGEIDFWDSLFYAVIGDAVFLILLGVVFFIQTATLLEIFLNHSDERQLNELLEEFIKAAKQLCPGYLSVWEERLKREREQKEAEARYRREHPVFIDYRDVVTRMERNAQAGSSSLTSHDHDDLDAVSRTLDRDYGGN